MKLFALFLTGLLMMTPIGANAETAANSTPYLDIQTVHSKSGLKAWLVHDESVPVISMQFAFRGGSKLDDNETQGLSMMLSHLLDEGAGPYSAAEFQKRLNDRSISLSFGSGRDSLSGNLETLSKYKEEAFALLKTALTKPLFDEESIARIRAANLARIRDSLSDPDWRASRLMLDRAYEGHPYALNSGGSISSLQNITREDLVEAHKNRLTRDRLVIGVSGDITAEELRTLLDLIFGDLPESSGPILIEDTPIQNQEITALHPYETPQTVIQMVWPGVSRKDNDYYDALVLNAAWGGLGFGSMLTEDIREDRGLTYGIHTSLSGLNHAPSLVLRTSTAHDNLPEMLERIETGRQRLLQAPLPNDKLQLAKEYLIGSLPLNLTSNNQVASILLSLQLDHLPTDYLDRREEKIRAVTGETAQAMAQKILNRQPMSALVGPSTVQNYLNGDINIIEDLPNVE